MLRRWGFLFLCFSFVAGLALWSLRVSVVDASTAPTAEGMLSTPQANQPVLLSRRALQSMQRRELVEVLDQIVAGEHDFQAVYGRYTRVIGQTGVSVPLSLSRAFEIVVIEASSDRLCVNALSEWDGNAEDFATIDQDFSLHTSFLVTEPRPEYLKAVALRNLRMFPEDGEVSLFTGYFQYSVRKDSQGRGIAVAIGQKAPVTGMEVLLNDSPEESLGMVSESGRALAAVTPEHIPEGPPAPETISDLSRHGAGRGEGLKEQATPVVERLGLEIERIPTDH